MSFIWKVEEYTGANCSGSSGDSNRVLTLANTGKTNNTGLLVYASGLALARTTEYTITHNSSASEITFINPMWDDMTIVVRYYDDNNSSLDDFERGPLTDHGIYVTKTPVTKTTDFSGQKVYTDGTNEDIFVVFINPRVRDTLDNAGLTEIIPDALLFTAGDTTINKYDKITYDSKVYRVDEVSMRNFGASAHFKRVDLFYIQDE